MKHRGALEILQLEVQISLLDSQARNLAVMAEYVDDSSRQVEYRKRPCARFRAHILFFMHLWMNAIFFL